MGGVNYRKLASAIIVSFPAPNPHAEKVGSGNETSAIMNLCEGVVWKGQRKLERVTILPTLLSDKLVQV